MIPFESQHCERERTKRINPSREREREELLAHSDVVNATQEKAE